MKTKLAVVTLIALAGIAAPRAAAQIQPAPDLIATWILWQPGPTPDDPPTPVDETFVDFSTMPIPADFFGPGSDPFEGRIYLRGFHNGTQPGDTDTIMQRGSDPFQPTDPPGPTTVTVPIEIVQLDLVSVQPITVQYSGGTAPDSFFDVEYRLSSAPTAPPSTGQLTAMKTSNNGGTFDSFFDVFTEIRFTNSHDPTDVRVLDLGADGLPLRLEMFDVPWVHEVLIPDVIVDPTTAFHPFVQDDGTGTQTEVPAQANTPPTANGPIVGHKICLPKPKRVCIYQVDCKSEPAGSVGQCQECPYTCTLYQGSPCPNFTCATGFTTKCLGTDCCLNFTNVDCRPPAGEPYVPLVSQPCVCDPALGACCGADGTCSLTTECDCQGDWLGPNTDCGAIGGCCFPDGSCADGIYQACCEVAMGGTFTAAGCSNILGKCCDAAGCRDNVDQSCCEGPFFAGGTCGTPTECCIGLSCVMMDPECCVALGGISGTGVCDPPQKCCLPGGACAMVEPQCCEAAGGTIGTGQCELLGCCLPDGTCIDADPLCCELEFGGTPQTTACEPVQACCFGDHTCQMLDPKCCAQQGGTPEGAGTSCDPVGACCLDTDGDNIVDSCSVMSAECCFDIPGSIFHANADCGNVGACCFDADGDGTNESCTQISQACCADLPNGTFNGTGTVCLGDLDGDGIDDACGGGTGQPCPLGSDWCWALQSTDCANGASGEQCWPSAVTVDFAGVPLVNQCACLAGTCGPVYITWLDVISDWSFRCLNSCPDPTLPCVIHFDGVATTATSVLASSVPVGAEVTCGCPNPPPTTCPLPAPDPTTFTVDCTNLQAAHCVNGAPGEECWPTAVTLNAAGEPVASACDCTGTSCGPVDVKFIDAINDWGYRCLYECPDPTIPCQIHFNGVPQGVSSVVGASVPFGVDVSCGCPQTPPDLCPLMGTADTDPCAALQQTDCKNGLANEWCQPIAAVITSSGLPIAKTCDCLPQTGACGPVTINGDIVSCQGLCDPLPGTCVVHANGVSTGLTSVHYGDVPVGAVLTCGCSDLPPDCIPNATQSDCEQTVCQDTTQKCSPKCAEYDAATGTIKVVDCDCSGPDDCHLMLNAAACVAPDDGTGTATVPPAACAFDVSGLPPGGHIIYVDAGLPPGTTLEMEPVLSNILCDPFLGGPGGSLGGDVEVCTGMLSLHITGTGDLAPLERQIGVPVALEVHTGPRTPGDAVQDFDTEMVQLSGAIFGDPDFDQLRLSAGSDFGLPSPGHTTLTRLGPPGSNFQVDSFFDVEYRIDFQGAPGSILQGMGGTDIVPPVNLKTGAQPYCTGGCPNGMQCVETVTVDPATGAKTVCCDCIPPPTCAPTDDGLSCQQTTCPDPAKICLPQVVEFDVLTGEFKVVTCDCVDDILCHIEIDLAANVPVCVGDCPAGTVCEQFQADTDGDGVIDQYKCDCVPIQAECSPTDAKDACKQTVCPNPSQYCLPTAVSWVPGALPQVEACDCIYPKEQCHVEFTDATGPYCTGNCPAGETCELFGIDTDGDGANDYWSCDCVPIQLECGPDPTQQWCNPVTCPGANQFCVPITLEIDPINGQVRVVDCECIQQGTGGGCHVTYDPASLQPFCEGDCPPGQTCELFGLDVNGDGIEDKFKCDCVDGPADCSPNATGSACQQTICPNANEICLPKVIHLVPGALPVVEVCDCVDPTVECHIEYDDVQGPHCVGTCPPGQTCELRQIDTDGDGVDDTFGCDCVPDTSNVCEPNATATDCKQTICPILGDICRPVVVSIGPNGQVNVKKCDCITPDVDCHVEFDAANQPYCVGTCPPGTTCELLGKDTNGDGIDDHFKCDCVTPLTECAPDSTGLACKQTICPVLGEICKPKVVTWIPGAFPTVQECECSNPDECHIEIDLPTLSPYCTGGCPAGTECHMTSQDTDGDGIDDKWECICEPITGQCAPLDDGSACQPTACPVAGDECKPKVITLLPGQTPVVKVCDCVGPNDCHVEVDAANQPFCTGACPDGTTCKMFSKDSDGDGVDDTFKCDCVSVPPVCEPTPDGKDCNHVVCPIAGQVCLPTHVQCEAGIGCFVISCECNDPDVCHPVISPPATDPPVTCQGACPVGYKCIPRIDALTGIIDCTCIKIPPIISVPNTVKKNRYLSIALPQPNTAGGVVDPVAIRVRLVDPHGWPTFADEVRWAGMPQAFPEENSAMPGLTFNGARLECGEFFTDWTPYGVVQLYGGDLVPGGEYAVQTVGLDCPDLSNEECYSTPVTIFTGKFGDIVPIFEGGGSAQPDFNDIAAVVAKFIADPTAPIKAAAQLQPNTPFPERSVDFRDIAMAVSAFVGEQYTDIFSGPCTCPSSVRCNATSCSLDNQCGGGLCVGGFCRDACQRCTP